jgi:hypothetical protein
MPDPLWMTPTSDSGSITGVEVSDTGGFGTTQKGPSSDAVTNLDSTETSSLTQLGPAEQKSATDEGIVSDLEDKNHVLYSSNYTNPVWTNNNVSITPNAYTSLIGGILGDKLAIPNAAVGTLHVQQDVILDHINRGHTLLANVRLGSPGPAWMWIDFADIGLDVQTWFRFVAGEVEFGTIGTDVDSVRSVPVVGESEATVIVKFTTASDVAGTVKFGLSDTSGSTTVAAHGLPLDPYIYLCGVSVGENYNVFDSYYVDNLATKSILPFWTEESTLKGINSFESGSDSGSLTLVENSNVDITGTIELLKSETLRLTSLEIGARTLDKSALDEGFLGTTESTYIAKVNYDPTWEEDDAPWGGQLLGAKDLTPVYSIDESFYALGQGFDKPLECYFERRAVVFDKGLALIGRFVFPQIIGPSQGSVWISLGGHNTPDGQVDWEGPYEFKIGEDVSVDFAVAGRYLAIRFESTDTSVWGLQSFDIDYEITGVY